MITYGCCTDIAISIYFFFLERYCHHQSSWWKEFRFIPSTNTISEKKGKREKWKIVATYNTYMMFVCTSSYVRITPLLLCMHSSYYFFSFWRCLHFTSHMVCSMVKKIDCHSPPSDIDLSR